MKTDLAHLSRIYQEHTKGGTDRAPCIDPGRLSRCVLGDMPRREREEIIGHAADCAECGAALRSLLALSADVERAAADLDAYSGRRGDERPPARGALWRRPAFVPVAAVSAGILLFAASFLLVPGFLGRSGVRGAAEAGVVLVSPVEDRVPQGDGIVLKWEKLAGAASYTIEVFDGSMSLLWRSGLTAGTETGLPAETVRKMTSGETYFWRVTALTGARREIRSKLAEFSVVR